MRKSTARGLGFVGAVGATVALIGAAVSTTGAYFTDTKDGSIAGGSGTVRVDVSNPNLNFDDLLPGEYQTQNVDYTAAGTGKQDLWLVFPTDGSADAFTHTPQDGPFPLGRYGHLKITSDAGSFESNNLTKSPSGYDAADTCSIDADGHGGNPDVATRTFQPKPNHITPLPYCAPRNAILLQKDMNPGQSGTFSIEYGLTRIALGPQATGRNLVAKYQIVATQHGVRPDNPNNFGPKS